VLVFFALARIGWSRSRVPEMVLQTTKHTMIYPGSGPSSEVIALRPMV
jgi:hypothetical protein